MSPRPIAATLFRLIWRILCVTMLWTPVFGGAASAQVNSEAPAEDRERAAAETVEEDSEDELSAEEQEALLRLNREVQARRASIVEIQSELGIYDSSLIEAYVELAELYSAGEEWDSAIETYSSALQIARIADGLESPSQLSLIDDLILSQSQREDWRAIDDLQHLALHIGKRLFPMEDAEYLASLNKFGDWKLRVLKENLLALSGSGMLDVAGQLSQFYDAEIERTSLNQLPPSEGLLQLNYGKAMIDIEMARAIARTHYSNFQGTVNPYVNRTRCSNVRNNQGQIVRQCYNVQVENPRYRRSQADAKQFALNRRNRDVADSIARLRSLMASVDLPREDRDQLEIQIRQMEAEIVGMRRSVARPGLF